MQIDVLYPVRILNRAQLFDCVEKLHHALPCFGCVDELCSQFRI